MFLSLKLHPNYTDRGITILHIGIVQYAPCLINFCKEFSLSEFQKNVYSNLTKGENKSRPHIWNLELQYTLFTYT